MLNPTKSDLGLLLNTGFNEGDKVVRAAKKARGMIFYLKRSFAALTQQTAHSDDQLCS